MPRQSPADLKFIEKEIANLESEFISSLSPSQINLLEEKRQQLAEIQKLKAYEAHQWLIRLANRYNKPEEKLDDLLKEALNPPVFLPTSDLPILERAKQFFEKEIEKDRLLKIQTLFNELDPPAQRECLQRLQALLKKP